MAYEEDQSLAWDRELGQSKGLTYMLCSLEGAKFSVFSSGNGFKNDNDGTGR